mmetsp:Transcript_8283/g.7264  ORF Transcript_8283/g.7264 Transcript_8283/m.7264 type:complete len:106 (-) Transcript_8283:92-409(-)
MMRGNTTDHMTRSRHGDMLDDIRRRSTLRRSDMQQDEKTPGSSKWIGIGIWQCRCAFPSCCMPLTRQHIRMPIHLDLGLSRLNGKGWPWANLWLLTFTSSHRLFQ